MITEDTLRDQLAGADPAADDMAPDVLDRVPAPASPPVRRRRWVTPLLTAAAIVAVALLGLSVLPQILPSGGSNDSVTVQGSDAAIAESAPSAPGAETGSTTDSPTVVRTASLLVGTEDPTAAADAYVRTVNGLGGQVTSQTVVSEGSTYTSGPTMQSDSASYPWYPTGPGVWLTVQVPADKYEQAIAAARASGEVVRLEQSAYDVGAEIADTDARVEALQSSVNRLRALMGDATSVSEVISLEDAIAARQSELDGLRAQQRLLRDQTEMSQISLTLMTPDDAKDLVDPSPSDDRVPVIAWSLVALGVGLLAVLIYRRLRRR